MTSATGRRQGPVAPADHPDAAAASTDAFSGFPLAALDFYEDLEDDNSRSFWLANRHIYDAAVRRPIELLAAGLATEFGVAKIFRPYRDVRYAKDKTPYKNHQGALIQPPGSGALYVQVGAAGLFVGGGAYQFNSDQVQRLRRSVADDVIGPGLVRILSQVHGAGFDIGGDQLTRVPAGYPKEHQRADLLRHKSITAGMSFGAPPWLTTPRAMDEVAASWRKLGDLNRWLERHVGASDHRRR